MKRILLQVSGGIHSMLFLGWLLPCMVAFAGGTQSSPTWVAIIAVVCIIGQMAWGLTETLWIYQMNKRKR